MTMKLEEYLDELFSQGRPIVVSKLVDLANLSPSDLKLFAEKWKSTVVERRRQVITKLEELAETNLEYDFDYIFKSCLDDPDPLVRVKAVQGLTDSEDYHLIDSMVRLLKEDSELAVRNIATVILGNFALLAELEKIPSSYTSKILQVLLSVIESDSTDVELKRRAIEAVAPFSVPQVKEIITGAYHSNDLMSRCSAVYAMGRNSAPQWLPVILAELNSSYPEMRFEAARACGEIGSQESVSDLIKLLDDSDIEVKIAAIVSLGEIGGKEAKNALLKCLEEQDPAIQEAVEEALAVLEFYQEPLSLSM